MRKRFAVLLVFGVALLAYPGVEIQRSSKQQQFAVELELCRQAQADGKPGKCALYGKIRIVDSFPDVRVQRVDSFPDIRVRWVHAFADKPGEWQRVDSFPDYRVQFVRSFPDYRIRVVDSFPGCD